MHDSTARAFDRVGAAAGLVSIALLVALLMFFPALPAADESIATIAGDASDTKQMLLVGDYVGLVMGGLWLLFGVVVAARLRRAEGPDGAWWMVVLAGITAAAAVGLVGNLFSVMFVRAVGHGVSDEALWTIYSGDLVGFAQGVPLAIFMLGAGFGTRATGVFPRWMGALALASVPLLVVGAASIAGREVDGGPFILPLMLAYLGMLAWTVAASVVLWRRPVARPFEVVATPA